MTLDKETEENFGKFFSKWTTQASGNWNELKQNTSYLASYRRIAAFNAVRTDLIKEFIDEDSYLFIKEAQNDLLVSHVNASIGAWRTSLQCLRAYIENILCGLYYMDHPIELRKWNRGNHKIPFRELRTYFEEHPQLANIDLAKAMVQNMTKEYSTLSMAVHGSAKQFRMTENVSDTLLWQADLAKLGRWETREKAVISFTLMLILCLFSKNLSGTKKPGIRKSLGYVFTPANRTKIKRQLKISIG